MYTLTGQGRPTAHIKPTGGVCPMINMVKLPTNNKRMILRVARGHFATKQKIGRAHV